MHTTRILAPMLVLGALLATSVAAPSAAADDTPEALTAPTVPVLTADDSRIDVSWEAIASPSAAVTAYEVLVATSIDGAYERFPSGSCAIQISSPGPNGCTVEGLSNGVVYFVEVRALSANGPGPASPPASATPGISPGTPEAITVVPGPLSLTVSWTPGPDGSPPTAGFTVALSDSSAGPFTASEEGTCTQIDPSTTSCTLTALSSLTPYYVRVTAYNAFGESAPSAPAGPTYATPGGRGVVTLAFGGDVHFSGAARAQAAPNGLRTLPSIFRGADIAMVNLETALVTHGQPQHKEYVFGAPPRVLATLKRAGVDVVTMANNHGIDYGSAGLATTLHARATSSLAVVGVGKNTKDAIRPWITHVGTTSFAYFGVVGLDLREEENSTIARTWPATPHRPGLAVWRDHKSAILAAIRKWSARVDVVVVYAHWGIEGMSCPVQAQRTVASQLSAAGADIIIGSHPHVLQGSRSIGHTFVAYSLGNFAWYAYAGRPSTALLVTVKNGRPVSSSWRPTTWSSSGLPGLVAGSRRQQTLGLIASRSASSCVGGSPARSRSPLTRSQQRPRPPSLLPSELGTAGYE